MLHLAVLGLFLTVELCVVGLVVASAELHVDFLFRGHRACALQLGVEGAWVVQVGDAVAVILSLQDVLDVFESLDSGRFATEARAVAREAVEGVRMGHLS